MSDKPALLQRVHFLTHRARIADDALRPFEDAIAFRRKAKKTEPRLTSRTPNESSSCFTPVAEKVGCVTPQTSAARPK